ncbi:MAG TPA: low temperature requirement protein A [Chloroflexia bacterium]
MASLWQRPRLRTDEEEHRERKTSWLELFFDLVFVVVVAELSHRLSEDISWDGLGGFVLLFVPVWWVWLGATFYNDRFETDDVSHRLFTFLQMLPVAALALNVHDGLGESSQGFALSYASARAILIVMWLRGGLYNPPMRPVTTRYAIGFSISLVLWVSSVFVPAPWRFVLWGLGLLLDLITPWFTLDLQSRLPRLSTSHLPERFGLFTIIVLGESVAGVVRGAAERHDLTLTTGVTAALGLAAAFCLWWVYFDNVMSRPFKPGTWWAAVWGNLHLPLAMSLTLIGAAVANIIAHEGEALDEPLRWLVCGAVGLSLLVLGLIEKTLRPDGSTARMRELRQLFRLGGVVVALALGFFGGGIGPLALLTLLVLVGVSQVALGLYLRLR